MTKEAPRPTGQNSTSEGKKYSILNDQQYWQKIFQNGDYNLYDRNRKPVQWDAFRDASYEWVTDPVKFIKNFGTHVHNIDTDFRGGKDAGGAKERLERMGAMLAVVAAFTAFDRATSFWMDDKSLFFGRIPRKTGDLSRDAKVEAFTKLAEVMNDKYATALGNMLVERLSGKRGFVHEVSDKGADTLTVGLKESLEDWVNGPNFEAAQRVFFQVPIVGALAEQGLTRVSLWQEKSPLHTATGKMFYMAAGMYMFTIRNVPELLKQKRSQKK